MKVHTSKLLATLALGLGIASAVTMAQTPMSVQAPAADVIKASTAPSKRMELNFQGIGVVKDVKVKTGQVIKKGEILLVQDTDIDEDELARLKLEANSIARLKYAELDKEYKEKVVARKTSGAVTGQGGMVFSKSEIDEAELDVARAVAQIDVVKEEMQASKIKVRQQETKIRKMQIDSPVDGAVETINALEGELSSLDTDKPAIIVVQKDPIHVVIRSLRTAQVAKLEMGESLDVKYMDETEWHSAKVIYKTPFADASSDFQIVWLEMPNPQLRDAGLPIQVKLPAKLLSAQGAARVATP